MNGVPYKFQLTSLEVEHVHSLAKEFCLSHHAAESSSAEQLEAGCTQVCEQCFMRTNVTFITL